ncbi:MAG: hypothetical protein HY465_04725 [Deltaproteobacteria bacterium]|nr:hypothetical protein [Deltaproteobacteria bacterium]
MNRFLGLLCVLASLAPSIALAAPRKLPNGAGTLSQGEKAFSLDLGYNFPSPILYEVRADFGIRNRFQFGIGASVLVIANVLTLYPKYNFWKTNDERNFLSAYLYPSVLSP